MTTTTPIPGPAYRVVTSRLVIRCWEPADAPLLKAAIDASIEHLLPWMPWAANEPTDIETKIALIRRFRGQFDLGQDFVYGIFDREETQALGGTGLHTRLGSDAREIGYWVRADGINQGIATEAAGALTRVAFEIDKLDRVEIHCDADNVRSAAVPRKLGFTHEATLRRRRVAGKVRDTMVWTLLADEYPGSKAATIPIEAFDVSWKEDFHEKAAQARIGRTRYGDARERWAEMSPARRVASIAIALIQFGLLVAALIDLRRRPAEQIRHASGCGCSSSSSTGSARSAISCSAACVRKTRPTHDNTAPARKPRGAHRGRPGDHRRAGARHAAHRDRRSGAD